MAADQVLRYTIEIDKKTGAVGQVKQELVDAEKAGKKLGPAAKEAKGEFDKLGNSLKNFAIGALVLGAVKSALEGNDAFEQLKTSVDRTAKSFVSELAPALDKMGAGLRSLLAVVGGFAKGLGATFQSVIGILQGVVDEIIGLGAAVVNLANGDWRGAMQTMKDATKTAGQEIKAGVDQDWKGAWEAIKKGFSDSVDVAAGKTRELTATSLEAMKTEADAKIAHMASLREIQRAGEEALLSDARTSNAEKQAIVLDQLAAEIQAENDAYAVRHANLQASFSADGQLTASENAKLAADKQAHEDAILKIQADSNRKLQKLKQEALTFDKAAAKISENVALATANYLVDLAGRVASGQKITARQVAADLVRITGEQAAAVIMANAATGASVEFAKGLVGVPAGLGILAKGAALAAGVAAITGAASHAISAGGGGAEASAAPELPVAASSASATAAGAAPGTTGGGGGSVYQIYVSGGDLLQDEAVARRIAQETARRESL